MSLSGKLNDPSNYYLQQMNQLVENISDTARWVAIFRAEESERPDAVFQDPFARKLAGEKGEQIANVLATIKAILNCDLEASSAGCIADGNTYLRCECCKDAVVGWTVLAWYVGVLDLYQLGSQAGVCRAG